MFPELSSTRVPVGLAPSLPPVKSYSKGSIQLLKTLGEIFPLGDKPKSTPLPSPPPAVVPKSLPLPSRTRALPDPPPLAPENAYNRVKRQPDVLGLSLNAVPAP